MFPPRAALRPGGAFWTWRRSPRFTNELTGGPMVLGPGAGNFDYRISGSWNGPSRETVSIHLWGGGNATSTDQSY